MNKKIDNIDIYQQIDTYLHLLRKNDGGSVFDFEADYHSTLGRQAFDIMNSENLISYRGSYGSERSIIDIALKGEQILDQGGIAKYYAERLDDRNKLKEVKELEREKLKVDYALANKMLKEYPRTKWFARSGFFIALLLLIIELVRLWKEIM